MFLAASVSRLGYNNRFYVIDAGLTRNDREWFSAIGVTVLPFTDPFPGEHRSYLKPYYISTAPTDRVVWVDTDAVIIRPIDELIDLSKNGPVFTPELYAPGGVHNYPQLYEKHPINEMPLRINAGVVVIDKKRDEELLKEWTGMVVRSLTDGPDMKKWVRLWDQGSLTWAIAKLKLGHHMTSETRFNYPANGLISAHARQRRKYKLWHSVFEEIAGDHPEAVIIHWMGEPKLFDD